MITGKIPASAAELEKKKAPGNGIQARLNVPNRKIAGPVLYSYPERKLKKRRMHIVSRAPKETQ